MFTCACRESCIVTFTFSRSLTFNVTSAEYCSIKSLLNFSRVSGLSKLIESVSVGLLVAGFGDLRWPGRSHHCC